MKSPKSAQLLESPGEAAVLPSHERPQLGREICLSWAIGSPRGTGRILIALCSFRLDICLLIKHSPSSEAALPGRRNMHKWGERLGLSSAKTAWKPIVEIQGKDFQTEKQSCSTFFIFQLDCGESPEISQGEHSRLSILKYFPNNTYTFEVYFVRSLSGVKFWWKLNFHTTKETSSIGFR